MSLISAAELDELIDLAQDVADGLRKHRKSAGSVLAHAHIAGEDAP